MCFECWSFKQWVRAASLFSLCSISFSAVTQLLVQHLWPSRGLKQKTIYVSGFQIWVCTPAPVNSKSKLHQYQDSELKFPLTKKGLGRKYGQKIIIFKNFIELQLIYNVVLISLVQQSDLVLPQNTFFSISVYHRI